MRGGGKWKLNLKLISTPIKSVTLWTILRYDIYCTTHLVLDVIMQIFLPDSVLVGMHNFLR